MEAYQDGFLIWDVETTGNNPVEDDIISIGGVMTCFEHKKGLTCLGDFSTYVHTTRRIDPEAEAVHHISQEMIQDAPVFREAIQTFHNWIRSFKMDRIVFIGHNASKFDDLILHCNMVNHQMQLQDFCSAIRVNGFMDTLKMLKALAKKALATKKWTYMDLPKIVDTGKVSYALGHCHLCFTGQVIESAHDALADSRALFNVCASEKFMKLIDYDKQHFMSFILPLEKALSALHSQSGLLYQYKLEQIKFATMMDGDEEEQEEEKGKDLHVDPAWGNIHAPLPMEPIWSECKVSFVSSSSSMRVCLNCMTWVKVDVQDTHQCWQPRMVNQ